MPFFKQALTFLLIFVGLSLNPGFAKEDTPDTLDGTTKVSAEKVIELMQNTADLVVIDSRKPSDRAKGFIETSIGLPNTETNEASLAKHIKSKITPVAFYCNGIKCGRSYQAAKIAISLGYKNIYWFRGGWDEWSQKGFPAMK